MGIPLLLDFYKPSFFARKGKGWIPVEGGAGFNLSIWEEVCLGRCGVTWLDLLEPLFPASGGYCEG